MSDADSQSSNDEYKRAPDINEADDRALNQAFDLLGDQRRRYVLKTLYTTPESGMSADDLADRVLVHDPGATDYDRVRIRLHHQTLPRLAEDGIIDFDPQTGSIRYHGDELIDDLLAVLVG